MSRNFTADEAAVLAGLYADRVRVRRAIEMHPESTKLVELRDQLSEAISSLETVKPLEARICDSCDELTEDFVEENGLSLCQFCKA